MTATQKTFSVQSSSGEPYEVTFFRDDQLHATCTCGAGIQNKACKHRLNILAGDDDGILSSNKEEAETVRSWLAGTALQRALQGVIESEAEVAAAKKRADIAKHALNRIMHA